MKTTFIAILVTVVFIGIIAYLVKHTMQETSPINGKPLKPANTPTDTTTQPGVIGTGAGMTENGRYLAP